MRTYILALALLVAACAQEDSYEAVLDETFELNEQLVELLEGIKDTAGAEAAKDRVHALSSAIQEVNERGNAMPKPSAERQAELTDKYRDRMTALREREAAALSRLMANAEIQRLLASAFEPR